MKAAKVAKAAVEVLGLIAIVAGCALISHPLALIVLGVGLIMAANV